MAQQLIVEGNDAIALANICIKRQLPPPKGYSNPRQFAEDFVKSAGSYERAIIAFEEALKNSDLSNIGVVVDANEAGVTNRWDTFKRILNESFPDLNLNDYAPATEGIIIKVMESLTVGIWIMPDNINSGYLEHFIAR